MRDVELGVLPDVTLGIRITDIPTRAALTYNDLKWRSRFTLARNVRDATKACPRAIAETVNLGV